MKKTSGSFLNISLMYLSNFFELELKVEKVGRSKKKKTQFTGSMDGSKWKQFVRISL